MVDLREVDQVSIYDPTEEAKTLLRLKRPEQCFDVKLAKGEISTFEARSASDAMEWVEKLNQLISYWKRRHRIEWVPNASVIS